MAVVKIATNFNIDIEFVAPPFYRRLLAWVLDIIIQLFYVAIAMRLYIWISDQVGFAKGAGYTLWAIELLLILPFLLYHLIMEVTMNGQSIGKKIMGIRVISENGGTPSFSQFIIRWLIRTSDYTIFIIMIMIPYAELYGPVIYWGMLGSLALLIVDIVLVNSSKQQRLGDILAHTVLINTKQKEKITDTVYLEVEEGYKPFFPEVMQMSDKDINALKGIIDTAKRYHDFNMAAAAAEKIKRHLKIETNLAPLSFLQTLLKDYNYLSSY
ncbi:MAG: RDD family protein [Candidatus Dadabacteria bacterium]